MHAGVYARARIGEGEGVFRDKEVGALVSDLLSPFTYSHRPVHHSLEQYTPFLLQTRTRVRQIHHQK